MPTAVAFRSRTAGLLLLAVAAGSAGAAERPPYEGDLLALADRLGAVSYLDTLCGNAEAGVWRARMKALVDAQPMAEEDRRRIVDAYNRGQRSFAAVHRTCTDETRRLLAHYLGEGAAIADRLKERFGPAGG